MVSMREAFESFTAEQQKRLETIMEKHSPDCYDPAADDMTIPFAIKLAEQDDEITKLRIALRRIISLDEKNVPRYAQQIAAEALWGKPRAGRDRS